MGVRGLEFYCERFCDESFVSTNILKAAEYFERTQKITPVLIVDGLGLIRALYGKKNWFSGGQWLEYVDSWKNFVAKFKDAGIKLVFFFDGVTCESKIETWVNRRLQSIKDIELIFGIFKSGEIPPDELFQIPASLGYYTRYVLKYECDCECITSLSECDWEISRYARKNQCFGILGQDSDFIIYDTVRHYFSAKHLDVNSLNTREYNRYKLSSSLGLHVSDLPLYACLVGNDFITRDELLPFHRKLVNQYRPRFEFLLPAIAKYILCKHRDLHGKALEEIAIEVFGGNCKINKLKEGVGQYDLFHKHIERAVKVERCSLEPDLISLAERLHVTCEHPPPILSSICGAPYQNSTNLEDSTSHLPSSAILFRKIRQHVYFLLRVDEIEEWCPYKGCTLEGPDVVKCCPIGVDPVDLRSLWSSTNNTDLKWKLFVSCVSKKLSIDLLRALPAQFVSLCSVLHYLLNESGSTFLKSWEVDAFLLQAVRLVSMHPSQLDNIVIEKPIDPTAVELASILVRGLNNILLVVGTIGGPIKQSDVMPWKCFDGKLFSVMYKSVKIGKTADEILSSEVALTLYHNLKVVVTTVAENSI